MRVMGKQELVNQPATLKEPIEHRFNELVLEWKAGQGVSSSLTEVFAHPAYRAIVAMGSPVVPFLLAELEREPDWWFAALKAITGADPVSPQDRGRLPEMTQAWLEWGRAHGVRW
jgi:hypothetical protein